MGTFKPIVHEDLTLHEMDEERFELLETETQKINQALCDGKRVITVGTTATRVLEHCEKERKLKAMSGKTGLFIYPGYEFRIVSGVVSNLHMPKSTPLLLVSAFGGVELIRKAYRHAIAKEYRFYSYGDSMMIL